VGKGTNFKIYLPRTEDEVDESGPGQSGVKAQQGTETLLLVEDEEAVRALVRNVLREKGYSVLKPAAVKKHLNSRNSTGGRLICW
jgi:hypothetical protein